MPPTSSAYRMADRLSGGRLNEILLRFATDKVPWEQAAKRLYAEYGIEITGETAKKWHTQSLGDEAVPA